MKTLLFGTLIMIGAFAIGSTAAAPAQIVESEAAADPADNELAIGGCRYFCSIDNKPYIQRATCVASCPGGFCEPIC